MKILIYFIAAILSFIIFNIAINQNMTALAIGSWGGMTLSTIIGIKNIWRMK